METEKILAAIKGAANTIATPNWATILSAIASIGAILAAVIIAIKQAKIAKKQNEIAEKQAEISDQQNKIALFEKKYDVFCELFKIVNISDQIDYSGPHKRYSLLHEIEAIYGIEFASDQDIVNQLLKTLTRIKQSEYIIKQSAFLFDCLDEADIDRLIESMMECMIFIIKDNGKMVNTEANDVQEFITVCTDFNSKYLDAIKAELSLK